MSDLLKVVKKRMKCVMVSFISLRLLCKAVFDIYIDFINEGNYIGGRGEGTG